MTTTTTTTTAVIANNNRSVSGSSSSTAADVILRFLAFGLTLIAAVVLGVDKQTKVVSMPLLPSLPPLNIPVTAKSHYLSAFVYFVVANAIACGYSAISLVLVLMSRGNKKGLAFVVITVADLIMVALLFSGGGAALAVGVIGYQGNSHVQWNKVCNVFEKFCHQVAAAIAVSFVGAAVYLLLVLLATLKLHSKLY